MKIFVLISSIIELLAGSILLFVPQLVPDLADAGIQFQSMARMYGAAAIALGIFALHVWKNMGIPAMRKAFLQSYLLFNAGVAISFYMCHNAGIFGDLGGTILHTLLAAITAFFYFRNSTT